jgi:hypothetical protein
MRTVAILCAAKKTAYRDMEGVEVYDIDRDARTFGGGMPVVAHPPCRRWTKFGDDMLKGLSRRWPNAMLPTRDEIEAEKNLGIWCAEQVKENGGILEHPARSRLFATAGLPLPGSPQSADSFSLHVWQRWWGFPTKKGTWLYFRNISQFAIEIPFVLHNSGRDRDKFQNICHDARSRTTPAFGQWLVALARSARMEVPCTP